MATGSQTLTTYYAKRIIGDTAAADAAAALLQTGENIKSDEWIIGQTYRNDLVGAHVYGIKYAYDETNANDAIELYGGHVESNADVSTAWIKLNTGDIYILGKVGIGYDPTTSGNSYKLYVNGSSYFSDNVYINKNTDVKNSNDSGSLVIGSKEGENLGFDANEIMARSYISDTSTICTSTLNLNIDNSTDASHLANVTIGNTNDSNAQLYVRYATQATTSSTGALHVHGGAGIEKNVGIGGNLTVGQANINTSYKLYINGTSYLDGATIINSTLTLNGNLYMDAGKDIYMKYNDTNYDIIVNYNNGNTGMNAAGSGLYLGYSYTSATYIYYTNADNSTRTKFFEVNSNGAYALTRFGVNGQSTSYNFYVNGNGFFAGAVRIQYDTPNFYIKNTSTDANTYAIMRFGNSSNDNGAVIFLNDPNRTTDGGENMMTIRNNVGDLRLDDNTTITGTLYLTRTTDAEGTADNRPALIIGPVTGQHLEFDGNEIMSKATETTTATLYINNNGGLTHHGGMSEALTLGVTNTDATTGRGLSLYNGAASGAPTYGIMFAGTATFGTHVNVTSDWATYFTMSNTTTRGWIFRRGSTNVASIDGRGRLSLGYAASTDEPGIYWNPYVESASDASDVSKIYQIKSGVAGGTELRISQANDSTDVINIVSPSYIYFNSKKAFNIGDSWLRINEDKGFSSGIYTGTSLIRTDNQLQVGSGGANFYATTSETKITTMLSIVNNSSNNGNDALVYIECKTANDWAMKINKGGTRYGLYIDSLDQDDAIRTNGYIRARMVWANQGSNGERQVGVDSGTSGNLYLWSNTTDKGLYSNSGYRTGYVIRITSSATTFYGALSGNASSATYASSYLANRGSVSGSTHAEALKAWFNANKSTEPRNALVAHYSSAHSNGSLCMGYFLSGYDSNPYGGFFVCHYDTPRYVGISNGTYNQHTIMTDRNYTSWTVTKTGSGASGSWGISVTGNAATATRINGNLGNTTSNEGHNIWVSSTTSADGIPKYISSFYYNPSASQLCVPSSTRIYANGGALYLGNSNNASWVYLQDCCSQASGTPWKLTQAGVFSCSTVNCGTVKAPSGHLFLRASNDWYLACQTDGNLVWYNSSGQWKWQSGTSSSRLIKQDIQSITKEELDKFQKLNAISFKYKPEIKAKDKNRRYGLIAEELLELFPNLVDIPDNYDETEFDLSKGINQSILQIKYNDFIPLLIQVVQNQQKEIDELRLQISKLTK